MLKAPGTKRFELNYGKLLSNVGFKFNLRRYTEGGLVTKPRADVDIPSGVARKPRESQLAPWVR